MRNESTEFRATVTILTVLIGVVSLGFTLSRHKYLVKIISDENGYICFPSYERMAPPEGDRQTI